MEVIVTFLIAVATGVACHYTIKWLDGTQGQQITYWVLFQYKSKKESPDCAGTRFGDSILCPHGLIVTFLPIGIIAYAFLVYNILFNF